MAKRSLTDIALDLQECANYNDNHTLEVAFRYLDDLRMDMLMLVEHLQEVKRERSERLPDNYISGIDDK